MAYHHIAGMGRSPDATGRDAPHRLAGLGLSFGLKKAKAQFAAMSRKVAQAAANPSATPDQFVVPPPGANIPGATDRGGGNGAAPGLRSMLSNPKVLIAGGAVVALVVAIVAMRR